MKITIFTSNQPRHIALINRLAAVSTTTFAIMECNTVFPGLVQDFYRKSDTMQDYFSNVMNAERNLFGELSFMSQNVRSLALKAGDLNFASKEQLIQALDSDLYIVFGASYIKSWLIDFLIEREAINIHMGLSPYYRGSSCNFWALFDGKPEYVGATIHRLSKGLDSGPIMYHAVPELQDDNPFEFTMRAVEAAQKSLVERISSGEIHHFQPLQQNKFNEIRYTKNADFSDAVARDFLSRNMDNNTLREMMSTAIRPALHFPYFA